MVPLFPLYSGLPISIEHEEKRVPLSLKGVLGNHFKGLGLGAQGLGLKVYGLGSRFGALGNRVYPKP